MEYRLHRNRIVQVNANFAVVYTSFRDLQVLCTSAPLQTLNIDEAGIQRHIVVATQAVGPRGDAGQDVQEHLRSPRIPLEHLHCSRYAQK